MPYQKSSTWRTLGLSVPAILVGAGLFISGSASARVSEHAQQVNVDSTSGKTENQVNNSDHRNGRNYHGVFEILQQKFETPQDLTKACLTCHIDDAYEVTHTTHWTWEYHNKTTGQTIGKKNVLNNFCIGTTSNEPRCTSCHVGYGWKDDSFNFRAEENVDCLVCHDSTGTYKKPGASAGMPDPEVDLAYVAQNIGAPTRDNCLVCHANGGGADAVKHGDMCSSLEKPDHTLDVHMDIDGLNFTCTECHTTTAHNISGSRYEHDENVKTCVDCHDADPHEEELLNTHTETLACQTCHIPKFARGGIPTKMSWDWSTAGRKTENGKILVVKDEAGNVTYHSFKGHFTYGENVIPEYIWFNGTAEYTLSGDTIDPTHIVPVNSYGGNINDPSAKIWPVKRFTGKQVYDSQNNTLITPHLFGKDNSAYWRNFDWDKASATGMKAAGLSYSGKYGFVETESVTPITHTVAPAGEAVQCQECHSPGGRLDFAALGYPADRIEHLIWDKDQYPKTSKDALNELVSYPDKSNVWVLWLIGILVIGGIFEIVITRRLED